MGSGLSGGQSAHALFLPCFISSHVFLLLGQTLPGPTQKTVHCPPLRRQSLAPPWAEQVGKSEDGRMDPITLHPAQFFSAHSPDL